MQQSQETGESYKKIPCPLIITLNLGEYTPNTCSPDTLVQFKLSTVLTLNSITCFYCKFEEVMKKKKWQRKLIKLYTLKMVEIPPTSKCLIKLHFYKRYQSKYIERRHANQNEIILLQVYTLKSTSHRNDFCH